MWKLHATPANPNYVLYFDVAYDYTMCAFGIVLNVYIELGLM